MVEYIVAIDVTRVRFPADASASWHARAVIIASFELLLAQNAVRSRSTHGLDGHLSALGSMLHFDIYIYIYICVCVLCVYQHPEVVLTAPAVMSTYCDIHTYTVIVLFWNINLQHRPLVKPEIMLQQSTRLYVQLFWIRLLNYVMSSALSMWAFSHGRMVSPMTHEYIWPVFVFLSWRLLGVMV